MVQRTSKQSHALAKIISTLTILPVIVTMQSYGQSIDGDDGRSFGITWRPDLGENPYLEYALEPQFASVVGTRAWSTPNAVTLCSGTVLDTTTVLTASHCIDSSNTFRNWPIVSSGVVSRSSQMLLWPRDERKMVWVDERIRYPEFDFYRGGGHGGFDIAIYKLEGRGAYSIAHADLNPEEIPLGTVVTQVGEGAGSPMNQYPGGGIGRGVLRAADNVFDAWTETLPNSLIDMPPVSYDGLLWSFYGGPNPFGSDYVITPSETQLGAGRVMAYDYDDINDSDVSFFGDSIPLAMEGGGAPGDSGGPIFALEGDDWKVVGVFMGWWNKLDEGPGPGGYGSIALNTSVSPFIQWIQDYQNESVWDREASPDADFDDPMNWWTEGERAVPDSSMNIVFRLPWLAYPTQTITGNIDPRWNEQIVRLTEDQHARRLRVRWGSGITIDLGGYDLTLLNESEFTTAIQVGYDQHDWPILRLKNGTCTATDISIAEFGRGHYDGSLESNNNNMAWTRGEVEISNTQLDVVDSVYLGERKAPITNLESYRYRPPPGWGILKIQNNSQLTVGNTVKIGRGVESIGFAYQYPDNSIQSYNYGLCGELHVSADSSMVIGEGTVGQAGWIEIGNNGSIECAGLIFANVLNDHGVFEIVDRYANYSYPTGDVLIWRGRSKVSGSFNQSINGTTKFSVSGLVPYEDFDRLEISGQLDAGGTLEVEFDQGFVPAGGDQFELISASGVTGEFDSVVALGLPSGMSVRAEYATDSVTIEVLACLADLNQDGQLDFLDISAFLGAFSQQNPPADLNGDGEYDFLDISAFLSSYSSGCP